MPPFGRLTIAFAALMLSAAAPGNATAVTGGGAILDCAAVVADPRAPLWFGKFQGGRPARPPGQGNIALGRVDWREVEGCFPSQHACDQWVRHLRAGYHRPQSWHTCLPLR